MPNIREMGGSWIESGTALPASRRCEYLHLPLAPMAINMDISYSMAIDMGIPYCMTSVLLAYKYRNQFPIVFSLFLRTRPSRSNLQ
jgi:hypothetical protein